MAIYKGKYFSDFRFIYAAILDEDDEGILTAIVFNPESKEIRWTEISASDIDPKSSACSEINRETFMIEYNSLHTAMNRKLWEIRDER